MKLRLKRVMRTRMKKMTKEKSLRSREVRVINLMEFGRGTELYCRVVEGQNSIIK